jgi:glutamate-1-semialdehyde 2,1-aminomutase
MENPGQILYRKAKTLIPGGTQLLSKRPEMFAPEIWPAYYTKAKGCKVWDMANTEYLDMSIMGIGANVLGYADDDVDSAVIASVKNGSSSSLNCPEEVELAELLIKLHPWADMVRYTRSGGEAMAMAVRIARAKTGKDKVLFSGYHGWMDWYLAANIGDTSALDGQLLPGLEPNGVPRSLKGTALPFDYKDIDNLRQMLECNKDSISAVVIEPARGEEAPLDVLKLMRELCDEFKVVLIFDEITSGFRMCAGGIHLRYGINPDIAVFAKSIANGYAMAAVLGTESVMQAAQTTFISSTNWTERIGPVAALATIKKYIEKSVEDHIIRIGNEVTKVWSTHSEKHGLDISISGLPSLNHISFLNDSTQGANTYFVIEMIKRGILGYRQFKPSFAHQLTDVGVYSEAVDDIFAGIAAGEHKNFKDSELAHVGFKRLMKE